MARRYKGNIPSNVSKDAKYSLVRGAKGWEVRLVYRLNATERALVTTAEHPDLVELVNGVKEDAVGVPGGAFYKHAFPPYRRMIWIEWCDPFAIAIAAPEEACFSVKHELIIARPFDK